MFTIGVQHLTQNPVLGMKIQKHITLAFYSRNVTFVNNTLPTLSPRVSVPFLLLCPMFTHLVHGNVGDPYGSTPLNRHTVG